MTLRVRFAPSPTGRIHIGNVRSALLNYLFAKSRGGEFMLRLDDTDTERSTDEFAQGIVDDLAWLGLTHDLTAKQSDRFDKYDEAAENLKEQGLLYACYETPDELEMKRKRQRLRGLPPVYDRSALELSAEQIAEYESEGRKPHWRFKLSGNTIHWDDMIRGESTVETASISDPILIRADGTYLYTLPSVVDDIDFEITHIIRGEDHVTNSGAQIEVFEALGGKAPVFGHHPWLVGADGKGLSKRLGSLSIQSLREDGYEAMAVNSLLTKIGTSDPVEVREDVQGLLNDFGLEKISRSPARFDEKELDNLNAALIHNMDFADVADRLKANEIDCSEMLWNTVRENLSRLGDVAEWLVIVEGAIDPVVEDREFLDQALEMFPEGNLTEESWSNWTNGLKEKTGRKGKKLFMPLRQALTGLNHGPNMQNLLVLIGAEKARARLAGERA